MEPTPRAPKFLAQHIKRGEHAVSFKPHREPEPAPQNLAPVPKLALAPEPPVTVAAIPEQPKAQAPAPIAPPVANGKENGAQQLQRLNAAIETLREQSARLAEQARSDALEIGFQVARRILETELSTSVEPLFALIRSALRRAGDSRTVRVQLAPADAARLEKDGNKERVPTLSTAQVQIIANPTLSSGDVMVDTDFGTVDGRLKSRIDELQRAAATATESAA